MKKPIEYKGYIIISSINKKMKAVIKNNMYQERRMHSPIYECDMYFIFDDYDNMIKFMDDNPR